MPGSLEINFYFENIQIFPLPESRIREWIVFIINNEKRNHGIINIIFCDDLTLLKYNKKYLSHDTLTDVITFDYSEEFESVSGDIFISKERVEENAMELGFSFREEMFRVIFHGVLHLVGFKDKSKRQKILMREREDYYLKILSIV